jgi:hypothetical protein
MEKGVPTGDVARELGIGEEQVLHIQSDTKRKIKATEYLRAEPKHIG